MMPWIAASACKFVSFSNLEKDVINRRARAIFQGVALIYSYPSCSRPLRVLESLLGNVSLRTYERSIRLFRGFIESCSPVVYTWLNGIIKVKHAGPNTIPADKYN
jgi:hypothetical protein